MGKAMQIHMHEVGQQKKMKKKSAEGEWRKKETKDLQILQGRHKSAMED